MTHRLTTNFAKNYCNRTLIVKVIVENVVTCFFWDTVYSIAHPSVTYADQSKMVEVKIVQFSPYSSSIPLVFHHKFHPEILMGSP